MASGFPQDALNRAAGIRLVIFDIDGVLTDGRLFFDRDREEYKGFHSRDGLGIKLLQRTGVQTAVISGRFSAAVALRMDSLGVAHVYQGQQDKLPVFESLCRELSLAPEQIAHVGDDLPDLPLLRRVGLAVAVSDAHASILPHVHWITANPGGAGAAREVCDLIMRAQGTLDGIVASHY
jgi:3-deoxy-D-manno-octulosonate 8-phosphate phosphatase (KDO 8-P phosphatase)